MGVGEGGGGSCSVVFPPESRQLHLGKQAAAALGRLGSDEIQQQLGHGKTDGILEASMERFACLVMSPDRRELLA